MPNNHDIKVFEQRKSYLCVEGISRLSISFYALLTCVSLHTVGAFAHGDSHAQETPAQTQQTQQILAPGYDKLAFEAPQVGTYQLPVLGIAGDGDVLSDEGHPIALSALLGDKPVLLSFVYTTCSDVNGCPLASFVMAKVAKRVQADPELNNQVRLISLSFNPEYDTPTVMSEYGSRFRPAKADWQFVTCDSEATLAPILSKYNQRITKEYDANGEESGSISHILRVFLIDKNRKIRNIYSVSFLHADTIINDFKTILQDPEFMRVGNAESQGPTLHGAGDDKSGYETKSYQTSSDFLPNRQGQSVDLLSFVDPPPLGLPALEVPANNPLTKPKIQLGRKIFFDRRLSLNQTISCGMCHVPEQGFAHNELAMAVGLEGRTVRRNSPTMYNVGYHKKLFHDARDELLEHQIWQPLLAKNEMANPSIGFIVNKFHTFPDYQGLFEQAFEGEAANIENIGMAVASYARTLVSANSRFDRWKYGKEEDALNDAEKRGFEIFSGKGRCSSCHAVAEDSALFTDHKTHNTGIGYERTMAQPTLGLRRVLLAPGIFIDVEANAVAESSEEPPPDLGEYEITQNPDDRWKYRTPSLRNIALTHPYMHDGSLGKLEDVVNFYNRGGVSNPTLDPLIQPLQLNEQERTSLVAFLNSLTGDNVDDLIRDAFNAPVGNAAVAEP